MRNFRISWLFIAALALTLSRCDGCDESSDFFNYDFAVLAALSRLGEVPYGQPTSTTAYLDASDIGLSAGSAAHGLVKFDFDSSQFVGTHIELTGIVGKARVQLRLGSPTDTGDSLLTLYSGQFSGDKQTVDGQIRTFPSLVPDRNRFVGLLTTGSAYVVVQTEAYPKGEIRGQTGPAGSAHFTVKGNKVDYLIQCYGLAKISAVRLYNGTTDTWSEEGLLRSTIYDNPDCDTRINNVEYAGTLTGAQVTGSAFNQFLKDLQAGNIYINVFTSPGRPAGEIRGQLLQKAPGT